MVYGIGTFSLDWTPSTTQTRIHVSLFDGVQSHNTHPVYRSEEAHYDHHYGYLDGRIANQANDAREEAYRVKWELLIVSCLVWKTLSEHLVFCGLHGLARDQLAKLQALKGIRMVRKYRDSQGKKRVVGGLGFLFSRLFFTQYFGIPLPASIWQCQSSLRLEAHLWRLARCTPGTSLWPFLCSIRTLQVQRVCVWQKFCSINCFLFILFCLNIISD